jgi:hypothetical protein
MMGTIPSKQFNYTGRRIEEKIAKFLVITFARGFYQLFILWQTVGGTFRSQLQQRGQDRVCIFQ